MPNLDPWVNQNEDMTTKTINKFENHLLSIRAELQEMIHPSSHPTYNERQQKNIELINWTLEKYKTRTNIQKMNEQTIIDNIRAIYQYLQNYMPKVPEFMRLLVIDLKRNLDSIMKTYPDLQHFCIKDIPDDRTKDVVVKGNQLEQTDIFDRFVKDEDTSGDINFLGISLADGRIIYVGSDGSIYSRFYFKLDEKIRVIYELYSKFQKIKAFVNSLDNYIG